MNTRRMCLFLLLAAPGMGAVRSPARAPEDTYIREFAKNKPRVVIITSGPDSEEVGRTLRAAILQHPENKHQQGDVSLLSVNEARALSELKPGKTSVVFLLAGKERPVNLPPALASALPLPLDSIPPGVSAIKGIMTHKPDGGLAYTVAACAPDGARLARLFAVLSQRTVPSFRELPLDQQYITNKLAIFSAPEYKSLFEHWGENPDPQFWNYVQWYPLDARAHLGPDQLEEASEVYFLDRSHQEGDLPQPAAAVLAAQKLQNTTALVTRAVTQDGRGIVVFTAPSVPILRSKAGRFPLVSQVPNTPVINEVADLRGIGHTALVVRGVHLAADEAEQLRYKLAEYMRLNLGAPVEEASAEELSGDVLNRGVANGAGAGHRYLWLFQITRYTGRTQYSADQKKLTADPGPFTEVEPDRPHQRRNESDDDYQGRLGDWRVDHRRWEKRRDEYEDDRQNQAPCEWERTLYRDCTAVAEGDLRLVDLEKPGELIWKTTCSSTGHTHDVFKSDTITIHGHSNSPGSIETPPNEDNCPADILLDSAFKAGTQGLDALQETAWLPNS